jgi:hypothetical protein
MRERCGCPDCDPPITGCLNPLLEEVERLRSECAVCEKCGHVQAEPNWCHECRHRTTMPGWAKPLLDAWSDRQNLREALEEIASGPDAAKGEDYGCLDLHEARTIAREALEAGER